MFRNVFGCNIIWKKFFLTYPGSGNYLPSDRRYYPEAQSARRGHSDFVFLIFNVFNLAFLAILCIVNHSKWFWINKYILNLIKYTFFLLRSCTGEVGRAGWPVRVKPTPKTGEIWTFKKGHKMELAFKIHIQQWLLWCYFINSNDI